MIQEAYIGVNGTVVVGSTVANPQTMIRLKINTYLKLVLIVMKSESIDGQSSKNSYIIQIASR